jgi:membrane fusion protein, multidrug efflux system
MKKSSGRQSATCAALIACTVLAACSDSQPHGLRPSDPVPVVVATAERRALPLEIAAVGTVEPVNSVQVKSRVDGQLLAAAVQDGQDVQAGELLFRIDPKPIQAQLEQAGAAVARDRAQLEQARAQAQRYEPMAAKGFVSSDQMAQVRTNEQVAAAALKVDEANVDGLQLQLAFTEIKAPIAGRVGRVLVQPGNLVKANDSNALLVLNQIAPIYVSFALPQRYLGRVRNASQAAAVAVSAHADGVATTEHGVLAFVDNAVDTTTGTVKMRARFDNADHVLWPGLFVTVTVDLGALEEQIVVPDTAVQTGPSGSYVFVVAADTAEQRTVSVTRSQNGSSAVASGLQDGERVVVDGQSRLTDGTRVAVTSPTP